jgi:cytosine/adenosine deaminase-related metal-dependent hydrolase
MLARRLAARWLLPIEGRPIERGALLVGWNGRIESVGPESLVPRPAGVPQVDLGDAAILPGLINTHTHLELTGFEGRVSEREFPSWIRRLRELKERRPPDEFVRAARRGLRDCYAAGVTTVADTGDSGAAIQVLSEEDASGVAYLEVFGPHPSQLEEGLTQLQLQVAESRRLARNRVRLGVSPHAPYTVSDQLLQAVAAWASCEQLPLAVHIAESPAEAQFLLDASGPFADAWVTRGIPLPSRSRTPVGWLAEHGALTAQTLCIHAVQLRNPDVRLLAESGAAVAHCPRSNRAHGHGSAPLRALLDAGIRVGLGTDSVASIEPLDLLAEARAAGRLASLTAGQMLELSTIAGARALGIESETGSLQPGKWADCVAIRLRPGPGTPEERVLASSPADVMLTCLGGRDVYRAT